MQKTLAILGAALIAAITIQTAAASDRHHARRAQPAPITQSVRDFQCSHVAIAADHPRLVALCQRRDVGACGEMMLENRARLRQLVIAQPSNPESFRGERLDASLCSQ